MDGTVKRRGILAAAGAVVAGIAAKQASVPVAAAGNLVLESAANTEAAGTGLTYTGAAFTSTAAFSVTDGSFATEVSAMVAGLSPNGKAYAGIYGANTSGFGVFGTCDTGYGVVGEGRSNHGVYGYTRAAQGSGRAGVYAEGYGSGTYGLYGNGYPLAGTSGIGVYGTATGAGVPAIYGVGQAGAVGVQGQANGVGVYGVSSSSYGILGVSGAGGVYSGITGSCTTATGAAFAGGATQASAFAAYFTGKVNIDGPLYVNGVQRFTLKHADGTSRLASGISAPEAWIEDFGKGTLANGAATVALDADFRAVADTSDYHVFLTEYGDDSGVYVATRDATGFTVRAKGNPSAGSSFSWRVVAKPRDGGGKAQRLAKYEAPKIKIPGINGEPLPPAVHAPTPPTPEKPKDDTPPAPAPPPRAAPAAPPAATVAPAATNAPAPAAVQPTTAPTAAPSGQPAPPPAPPART